MDLKDKRALITGGTSGMGSAVAKTMAEKGASVIITGRDETRGASTVEKIRAGGHDAQFIAADFSEMSEVRRVADAADEIDVLVNAAGFAARGPTADTDEAAFDGLIQINVKAPFFLVAALAPKIAARGGGSIEPGNSPCGACFPLHQRRRRTVLTFLAPEIIDSVCGVSPYLSTLPARTAGEGR